MGPFEAMPVTCERRGAVEGCVPGSGPRIGAWPAVSVETFRPVEIKHAICMQNFHGMQSFHVVAACGTAAPRQTGRAGTLSGSPACATGRSPSLADPRITQI
jgi:hypothetical protein